MSRIIKRINLLSLLFLLLCTVAIPVAAQSSDRDNPTPLTSNELSGELGEEGGEYFYSFVAGPGELTITVDVRSTDGTKAMMFELLNRNGSEKLLCCELAQADRTGMSGRTVKSIRLNRRQTVLLRLEPQNGGHGSYRVRLTGAVELSRAANTQDNRRSNRADVQSNGN